jgi:hypothetical protein
MSPFRRCVGSFVAALLVLLALQAGSARSEVGSAAVQSTDVLLAFDTTGSMGPSIAAAQRDAATIVSAVGGFAPNTRFAVASFRDRFYPGGQYTLVTPMTGSTAAVSAAIGKLQAVSTTDPVRDQDAEAYNLLFNKSYTDSSIGWRAASRKIVVVIGDAEPHSAGAEGLAGCADTTHDWNNLSTSHELAAMRAAKRTLVMIRQSATATTSLACYATLATRAYEGGAAGDGGGQDMGAPVLALLKQAYAPFVVTPQLASAVAGKTDGLTIRVANPNNFALAVSDLTLTLPAGVTYVSGSASGTLPKPTMQDSLATWQLPAPLKPYQVMTGHIVLRSQKAGLVRFTGNLTATPPDGRTLALEAKASIRFVPLARKATVAPSGLRGTASIQGALTTWLSVDPEKRGPGSIVLRLSRGRSATVQAVGAAAKAAGAPSNLSIRVLVTRSSGFSTCSVGTRGTLKVFDSDALTRTGSTRDRLALVLPSACGGSQTFADAASGQRLEIKLGFR